MAQSQTLQTIISINAQANGFSQVGATLTELGTIVDGVSQQLIDFGKESWETYKDYEKSMHEAEVALSTSHGRDTKELAAAMDTLNAKATEWAATTIFHTDDVANAINQAAHAGWNLDDILNGIPVAMQLAQAGSMDLSEALTYITKSMDAFGVPFEEMGEFVDMWVYAANSSVGDVQDFGDAMRKMGATMRFTDGKEELFALIGLMHDMGESGSTAATLLRTSMMRILAPSGVTSKVLEQLGATDEEINEIREDASKLAALKTLEDYGFSAFGDDKQAKPILQIYAELGEVLAEIAGGYDNITKNQTTLGILGTIFGNRGITGALDIVTALQTAMDLQQKLLNGEAEGYGEYAAETMMDTAYGAEEIFESKIERLKQVVGEELSGQIKTVMENIGHIVDDIAEMDEGKFSALVEGLKVIALAGPGLLLAGGAFRLIGTLLTPAGGIGLGLIALTAAVTALEKMQEADLKETFGDMDMDMEGITSYVQGLSEDFRAAYEYTDLFQQALGAAVTNYREATSTFSSNLFSLMITNAKLTPADLEGLMSLATQVHEYAQEALYTAASGDAEYWTQLFGGDESALEDPIYQSIIEKTNQAYEENKAELEGIGKGLREAITSAFSDEQLDQDEYQEILGYFRRYNEMVAQAAAESSQEEQRVQMRKWLLQAQSGDFDDINTLAKQAAAERDTLLQKEKDQYYDKMARLIENGGTEEEQQRAQELHEQRMNEISTAWDEFQLTLWDSQLSTNGQMDNWLGLQGIADQYLSGMLSSDEALKQVREKFKKSTYSGEGAMIWDNNSARAQLAKITGYMLTAMGGEEEVQKKIDYYTQSGNTEMANRLMQFYAMEQLANGFNKVIQTEPISLFGLDISAFGDYNTDAAAGYAEKYKSSFEENYTSEARSAYMAVAAQRQVIQDLRAEGAQYTAEILKAEGQLNGTMPRDFSYSEEWTTARLKGYRQTKAEIDAQIEAATAELERLEARYRATLGLNAPETPGAAGEETALPTTEGETEPPAMPEEEVTVPVTGDTTPLAEEIAGQDEQVLTERVTGDAEMLDAAVAGLDGQVLTEQVTGDTTMLDAAVAGLDGQVLTEQVTGDAEMLAETIAEQNDMMLIERVTGDATDLRYRIYDENGHRLTQFLDGDVTQLHLRVYDEDGQLLTEYVAGDTGELKDSIEDANGQHIDVIPDVDVAEPFGQENDGQMITVNVDGNAEMLRRKIDNEDGRTLNETVDGDVTALEGKIDRLNGKIIRVGFSGARLFADGGRASQASIFGEDGPEWAIPEEHSARTAELLDAAREASGFTWGDLLARFGGLNANPQHTQTTIVYSPTINAQDASGVERALQDDKRRFEKWFEDRQMRDAAEVYA